MSIKVLMPALSPTMTEGKLARWQKKEGDAVASGDVIAEIETDKATMEVEAVEDGTLGRIVVPEGSEGVAVNAVIALLLEDGEDPSVLDQVDTTPPAGNAEDSGDGSAAPQPPSTPQAPSQSGPSGPTQPAGTGRVFASPLARRLAQDAGIPLDRLTGSGPHGRIIKADVERAQREGVAPAPETTAAPAPTPQPATSAEPEMYGQAYTEVPNATMRKVIAQRLQESKQTIPHFYLTVDCAVDPLLDLRKQLNGRSDAYKLSVNDFIVRAVALALRQVPAANAIWTEKAIRRLDNVDVAVAVATDQGLITPVVRNADRKGLAELSNEVRDLATRAREQKLAPEEYQGGGFTISNLGMYGIQSFSAIINPPQSCILAVGQGEQRPVVRDGALAVATMMTCTLSVDHRSVDGAVGAEFLAAFKGFIEDPLTMML